MDHLDLDVCLELLADRQRRLIIRALREQTSTELSYDELIDLLAEGQTREIDGGPDRANIEIQLRHKHLPKMADDGIIEDDQSDEVVRYRPDEQVDAVLEGIPQETPVPRP